MKDMILLIGAFLGFFSVFFGAYSEHNLREIVTDEHFRQLMTGIRYNQVNSVMICAIGLAHLARMEIFASRFFKAVGYLFIVGTSLFSFSIYASITFRLPKLVYLTPVGGVTIMVSWLLLMLFGFLTIRKTIND
tara:strand:- start:517 stop:918 length:402 start_codon:yes stop_codon:yes gene_type:complete